MTLPVRIALALCLVSCGTRQAVDLPTYVPPPDGRPPNLVLVLVDDLGASDLGSTGSDLHLTPTLDRMAAEGVQFSHAYTPAPLCSPTRAALVTGLHPARIHLTDWIPGRGDPPDATLLEPDWSRRLPTGPTLGDALTDRGYVAAWHGKWHLDGSAEDHGFHFGLQDWTWMDDPHPEDPKGVLEVNRLALDFIDANPDRPFFVALSHYSVHTPIFTRPDLEEDAIRRRDERGPGGHDNPRYAAMVEDLDASVADLLDALDERGLTDQTIVVVASDNGGSTRVTDNLGLRAGKATLYDGGLRVPLIVWSPARFAPALRSDLTSSEDLVPTFIELAGGVPAATLDGQSLVPALDGRELAPRAVFAHYPHFNTAGGSFPGSAMRTDDDYKLIERFAAAGSTYEVYDLATDPGEQLDLAASEPALTAMLVQELEDWRADVGAQPMVLP